VASRGRLAGKKIPLYTSQSQISQMQIQTTQVMPAPVLKKNADYHMLYFEKELLPRFNISNSATRLDLKLLSDDPILLQSVIAVANAHATYRSANEKSLSFSKIQDRNNSRWHYRTPHGKLGGQCTSHWRQSYSQAMVRDAGRPSAQIRAASADAVNFCNDGPHTLDAHWKCPIL
jgi:hypothetical protein